ncbi:MAG TPA: CHAD domain-containing protein [Candidatus Acidoferrales bacterium]|nr:CHAD domain-containing protein [Candidatus Acidoferrales bacterium]
MSRVLQEHAKASKNLSGDPIHDLRTALRRCLTIESAMSELDPHPAWKKLRRTGKKLMKGLGSLRDSEVLLGWLSKFENANRTVGQALETSLQLEFDLAKKEAQGALKSFGREKWAILQKLLVERAARLIPETAPAQYLALERWDEAYKKHRFALRSRSKISYHRARAGLKTFRYTLENFMPGLHAKWRGDVKQLQDMLGEVHDLDVLWTKIVALRPAQNDAAGMEWKTAIESERMFRLAQYRTKTRGKNSIWQAWRAALPHGDAQEEAALAKLSVWSAYRTPEFTRAERVATLSAELYDLLAARGFTVGLPTERGRVILRAAALLEDVGRMSGNKGHHKESYRLIHKLPLPLGWRPSELQLVALVARYHRKALPQLKHKEFSSLSSSFRQATLLLAGILRLAICCEQSPIQIRRMDLEVTLDGLLIRAYGFDGEEPLLSKLATAKHLLEIACRRPIAILPGVAGTPVRTSDLKTKTAAA